MDDLFIRVQLRPTEQEAVSRHSLPLIETYDVTNDEFVHPYCHLVPVAPPYYVYLFFLVLDGQSLELLVLHIIAHCSD